MREKKILLVTGASSDIGCKLIREVAANYEVILGHYCHNREELDRIKAEIGDKLILLQADFVKKEDVSRMISEIDKLGYIPDHIVHLPAQKLKSQKFHKTEVGQYEADFSTSVVSIVLILQHFIPKMSKQKYGKILFMLTSLTLDVHPKYQAPYITAKYALLGLMRDISREYAEKGIMVNGISPDMIETKFLSNVPELVVQQNASNNPLGRNLTVEDVIPAFVYLLSDGADAVTGQNIGVTGGM